MNVINLLLFVGNENINKYKIYI